jgi:hypothetical protein
MKVLLVLLPYSFFLLRDLRAFVVDSESTKSAVADASGWYGTPRLRVGLVCAEQLQDENEDEYENEDEDEDEWGGFRCTIAANSLAASGRKVSPNRSGGKVV